MSTNDTTIRFGFNGKEVEEGLSGIQKWMERINQQNKTLNEGNRKLLNDFAAGFKGAAVAAAGYGYTIAKLVGSASNLEEVSSKFNVVFRGVSHDVESWVKDLQTNFLMSETAARGFLASTQDLLKPMGIMPDKAALMSMEMTKLAADLGSFNNMKTADVMRDLQAATTGSFEVTKKYGVVINEAIVKQKALSMALWDGTGEVSAAAKAQATLKLMMEGSADAIGDVARTSGSFANIQKRLEAQTQDFAASIGKEILPIAGDLVNVVTDIIKGFSELDPELKKVIITIGIAGTTTLAVTKIVTGFGVSFKKAIGPVTAVIGVITLFIAALSASKVDVEQHQQSTAQLTSSVKSLTNQFARIEGINAQKQALYGLKEGSAEYKRKVDDLLKVYPELQKQNITTTSTYEQISKAVNETSEQMNAQARVAARKTQAEALEALKKGYVDLIKLQIQMSNEDVGTEAYKKLSDDYKVLELTLTRSAAAYGQVGQVLDQTGEDSRKIIAGLVNNIGFLNKGFLQGAGKYGDAVIDSISKITGAARQATTAAGMLADVPPLKVQVNAPKDLKTQVQAQVDEVTKLYQSMLQKMTVNDVASASERLTIFHEFEQQRKRIIETGLIKTEALTTLYNQKTISQMIEFYGKQQTESWLNLMNLLQQKQQYGRMMMVMLSTEQDLAARLAKKQADELLKIQKTHNNEQLDAFVNLQSNLQEAASLFGAQYFESTKVLSIAIATIKGGEAAVSAYAAGAKIGGPVLGGIFATAAGLATFAQIKKIINTKPPALEMGGIISPSAQGTLFRAGEKSKPEAIIPLRGRGLNELKAALGLNEQQGTRPIYVTNNFPGTIMGDEIPDKVARGIDKAMLRLKRNGEAKAI